MARINIKDIAERAGVSKTAVSFAFNNPERLPETRVRQILQIAEEMGYTPDPVARTLSTGRTGTIGILIPQPIPEIIRNPFMPEFLEGVGEICTEASLSLMIVPPLKGSIQRAVTNAAVDGFLTLGLEEYKATMAVLRQRGVPYVTVDSDPIDGVPAVNVDDENGAQAVMQHVLEAGHRQITILGIRSGKLGHYEEYAGTLRHRIDGYLSALSRWDEDRWTKCTPDRVSEYGKGRRSGLPARLERETSPNRDRSDERYYRHRRDESRPGDRGEDTGRAVDRRVR